MPDQSSYVNSKNTKHEALTALNLTKRHGRLCAIVSEVRLGIIMTTGVACIPAQAHVYTCAIVVYGAALFMAGASGYAYTHMSCIALYSILFYSILF